MTMISQAEPGLGTVFWEKNRGYILCELQFKLPSTVTAQMFWHLVDERRAAGFSKVEAYDSVRRDIEIVMRVRAEECDEIRSAALAAAVILAVICIVCAVF